MDQELEGLMAKVAELGQMSETEAGRVVSEAYWDGIVTHGEAEALFDLNDKLDGCDPVWDKRFVGAIKDFLLTEQAPQGWVTEEECEWLIERVTRDGYVKLGSEMDLLLDVLRYAEGAPERLGKFTLNAVRKRIAEAGRATKDDVERMRRALYASAGAGGIWVTREEATVLFLTNDAVAFAKNDPAWNDLFARAIGNHLMAMAHPSPMSESDALARERWLDEKVSVGGFLSDMANSFGDGSWFEKVTYSPEKAAKARSAAKEAALRVAENIDDDENDWFMKRLGWDKKISPAEKALVEFLQAEAPGFADGIATISAA
ncbi:MAG: hypothetical protein V3V03_05645 [Hyphomonadaceae bacterium]